jgi:two-component system OmpR family sensor kinase
VWHRLRIEVRLTLGFASAMALLLVVMASVLYVTLGAVLLDEVDTGLRERAATIEAALPRVSSLSMSTALVEPREAFAQVSNADGTVIATSGTPNFTLDATAARSVVRTSVTSHTIPGVADRARVLILPASDHGRRYVIVVGASLSDRADALQMVLRFFLVGGPLALIAASIAGWLVARRALATAIATERNFLDHASHELRAPLTALKAELDLATSRPRSQSELEAAVRGAADETDRLVRLAGDLLLLSRSRAGRLGVVREDVALRALVDESVAAFRARAAEAGISITSDAPDLIVAVDRVRVRQALDNLLDNAIRHARSSAVLRVAVDSGNDLQIDIEDDGPGFDPRTGTRAFEPFAVGGLGLSIVRTIAEAHGGRARILSTGAGGHVQVTMASAVHPTGDRLHTS